MNKFLLSLFGVIFAVGLFVLIGTAGSSDLGMIDTGTSVVRCLIGFALMFGGIVGLKASGMERVERWSLK